MKLRLPFLISILALLQGCGEPQSEPLDPSASGSVHAATRSLYVTSGGCYAGGVAVTPGSNTVAVLDPDTGALKKVIADYSAFSPGDTPVAIANYDRERVLVAVENTSGRRLDLVKKDGSGVTTYLTNSTALNGVLRALRILADGSLLLAKSSAIEKFSSTRARVTQGANPFVNAPGSTCATSTSMMTGLDVLPNGKIFFAHSAASPNNKVGLISSTGYVTTADCLAAQAAPTTLALPTAVLAHSSGKVLVSYGSTTAASNSIQSYDVDPVTNVISNITAAFSDVTVVNGPSALAEDPTTQAVYVANGASTANSIERFQFNTSTRTLTRTGQTLGPNVYTRCVSAMKVLAD